MRILEAEPKELNNEQLKELIASLRRSEKDFETRLVGQVAALERAGRMHGSDPVYQSLFFLLAKFTRQLRRAQEEVKKRGVGNQRIGRHRGGSHSESTHRKFYRTTAEQNSSPSQFARATR